MKSSLRLFLAKQKPSLSLFIGLIAFAISVVVGLRVDATPMPTQTLGGSITTSRTLDPSYVYIVNTGVAIESGVTLTVPAGTIIKFGTGGPITVRQGGSLKVTGIAANPAHFTSIKDDTVGGDTNGDGITTTPAIDDFQRAVISEDGDVNIVFAKFNYAARAVDGVRTAGSLVITDSTFDNGRVAIQATAPTVKLYRNQFKNLTPDSMDGAVQVSGIQDLTKVSLSGIDQNIFTGTAKFSRIIRITQAILPLSKTWTVSSTSGATVHFLSKNTIAGMAIFGTSTPIIASGYEALYVTGTVNIQSGSWIKHTWNGVISVQTTGKLNISGTSTAPVNITSIKDDSIGGDTNGDGVITTPVLEDYSGIVVTGEAEVDITQARLKYFYRSVIGDLAKLSIRDSIFSGRQAMRIYGAEALTLERNTFNVEPGIYDQGAVYLSNIADISQISLSGLNKNVFNGNPFARTVFVSNSTLPTGKVLSVSPTSNAILQTYGSNININGELNLESNSIMIVQGSPSWTVTINLRGTMNIYDGATVKYTDTQGIGILEGSTLNIYGAATNKVNMTSFKDDTIGGDTNGDSAGTLAMPYDYGAAINLNGGSLYMIHTNLNYADRAIRGIASNVKVFDSKFTNGSSAIDVEAPQVKIYRNEFNTMPREFTYSAVALRGVQDISRIGLSGSDQNFFTGAGKLSHVVELMSSILPVDRSLTVSTSSGATLRFTGHQNEVRGTFTAGTGTILLLQGSPSWFSSVTVYGTLNISQGVIVKLADTQGIHAMQQGKVNITGTSSNKVKVTHYYDDSIGGDTNGDGATTSPTIGNTFISSGESAEVVTSNVDIYYTDRVFHQYSGPSNKLTVDNLNVHNLALLLESDGGVTKMTNVAVQDTIYETAIRAYSGNLIFRGSFSGLQGRAITACNWGSDRCSVDAAYTDWGASGPIASKVCGQVTVTPYMNGSSTIENNTLFGSANCDGSPTPSEQLSIATNHFANRVAARGIDCSNGFQDACQAMQTAYTCLSGAVQVAGSTSPFPLPGSAPHESANTWGASAADGAHTMIRAIEQPSPSLSALEFGGKLLSAVGTIISIGQAYNSCAP